MNLTNLPYLVTFKSHFRPILSVSRCPQESRFAGSFRHADPHQINNQEHVNRNKFHRLTRNK